ncbi:MAG TPA: hypothetical protein VFZ65_00450 [Planctomycetota bacterium]|nr:hypothetical protein [Planctomycetota bacterium]
MYLSRCLLASAALVGALPSQQFVQLPDNHFLGESPVQAQASGTANFWGGASAVGRRFQVLYDASHFTGVQGVLGPILIRHIRFRGEDTEHNRGGQTYAGVMANVYATTLTSAAALDVTFANNLPPIVATSTLLGTFVAAAAPLTVGPSSGRAPNNDIIDLDFTVGPPLLPFDPTGLQPNLLVDITYLAAANAPDPQATTMVAIQDTTGAIAFVRGRALYAASAIAVVGTQSSLPPTMRIEFVSPGPGGFPTLVSARNELYGGACGGSPSAFYQLFPHDTYFDLRDPGQVDLLMGLRLVPDVYPAPNFYTVFGGAAPVDLVNGLLAAPTSTGDDATVPNPLPPGAMFDYPGGSTGVVRAATNGYVIVDPASVEVSSDYAPTVAKWLGAPMLFGPSQARFAPFWHDFSPNKNAAPLPFSDPLSGMHVTNSLATNEVLVTWYRVGRFNSVAQVFQEEYTLQCSLNWATGVVQFRYGQMDQIWGDTFGGQTMGITGFTRGLIGGLNSVDPQSRDLSIERPFRTFVEGATSHMGQTVVAAPVVGGVHMGRGFVGQSLKWNANNVPAGSILGVQLLDTAASRPGLMLPFLTTPPCMLSVTPGAILYEVTVLPPPTVLGTIPLVIPGGYQPALMGFDLFAQYVVLDGLFFGGPLITVASNAVHSRIGMN